MPELKESKKEKIYLIHKHAATTLHFDLRLEMDGVLKSWAIPKEPPQSKGVKRLAIKTKDHPIDYADFEGCFEFYTKVRTEKGNINIGNIVNDEKKIKVLSYNNEDKKLEWKEIVGWYRNSRTDDFLRIRVPGQRGGRRVITVTPNHIIYTPEGKKKAKEVEKDSNVYIPGMKWTKEQKQILFGTLFGDAHLELKAKTRTPCFQLTHSGKQKEYLEFIRDALYPSANIVGRGSPDSYSFRFTDMGLISIYPKFYNSDGRKILKEKIFSKLDRRGLAIFYMDDGYLAQGEYVKFCTQGFSKEENQKLAKILNEKWQFEAKVYYRPPRKKANGGYHIHLSKNGSTRFLTLINDYLIPEMRYKTWIKKFKNRWKKEYQRRKGLVPARVVKVAQASEKKIRSHIKYDIKVKDNHNYFAGDILVSNSIPEGHYGAGTVEIWDKGTYTLEKRKEEKIVIHLNGEKLTGRYCLIRFKENWLFFKC